MITSAELEILRTEMPALERNFQQRGPNAWQWSCSICGDSKRDRRKARFGINKVGNDLMCHCFNCDWAGSFLTYLKYQHPDLAQRVNRNNYVQNITTNNYNIDKLIADTDSETLSHLFYINKFVTVKEWLAFLTQKKILISDKDNLHKLYRIHKEIHNDKQSAL